MLYKTPLGAHDSFITRLPTPLCQEENPTVPEKRVVQTGSHT
jgi:hypothetical protein